MDADTLLATHIGQLQIANVTMQVQIAGLTAELQASRAECAALKAAAAEHDKPSVASMPDRGPGPR